jgi:hypothetical protein
MQIERVTPVLRIFDVPLAKTFYAKRYPFMNPGLDPGPGERMLSTELIDPFANLIRFFERNVES